jgi:putative iron-dependent peroxidase
MANVQPGILLPLPLQARYLMFSLKHAPSAREGLGALTAVVDGEQLVAGIGLSLVAHLGKEIPGLRVFPSHAGAGLEVPSTPTALCCWLRGGDRGDLVHRTRQLCHRLEPAFRLERSIDAFQYGAGLDLTGYEDGTENPTGDQAAEVAIVRGMGAGLDGSSFMAMQQWVHDLDCFDSHESSARDNIIGRRKADNEELVDAPDSAHVKRTAQESFEPEAFILRRSMPWCDASGEGLVFVAFGHSFDAFEALMNRMTGSEDGITDALFTFTRPVTGSYFWCPPVNNGHLDLRAIGV